jgi:GDP-6-deoxy-D-talose 4-dehydrogenase
MPSCSGRVFVTGGTGLIGKEVVRCLLEEGFDVFALTRGNDNPDCGVHWVGADLFDSEAVARELAAIKPEYLLNLAWCASGDYLTSPLNERFAQAGLELLKSFRRAGGRRAVYAGTCFEYAFKDEPLKETDSMDPMTPYARCKNGLRIAAQECSDEAGLSFGWGRIFYAYGKNEHPKRLTATIVNSLMCDQPVEIRISQLRRDYIYTKDVAGAFVAFLKSDVKGVVNICTGRAISIGDFAATFARVAGKEFLLNLRQEQTAQPPAIVGDTTRLRQEVGYHVRYSHEMAVREILESLLAVER